MDPSRRPAVAPPVRIGGSPCVAPPSERRSPSAQWGRGVPITRNRSGTSDGGGAACLLVVVVVATVGMVIVADGTAEQQSSETTLGLTSLTGTPTTDPGLGGMAASRAIDTMVSQVLPSTVALRVRSADGAISTVTGLVAEAGGVVVTASSALAGARSVTAMSPTGRGMRGRACGDRPDIRSPRHATRIATTCLQPP